ncbi:Alpha/Beta hydrolase protein, partial [Plectosphaerella plurivora]
MTNSPRVLAPALAATAVLIAGYLYIHPALKRDPAAVGPKTPARSPRYTVGLPDCGSPDSPYPPDVLPGGRHVDTPYGSLHVYEFGPSTGPRVLLLHGIGTPCLALGRMARALAEGGCRVMLFDFFGRGYSDAPDDLPYDSRLYNTQILLALASSSLPWTGDDAFHLVGYSLGGAIAASFANYHAHTVRSLSLVAGGGLIRTSHVSTKSRLLYSEGTFPERLLRALIRRRLWPEVGGPADMPEAEVNDDAPPAKKAEKIESDARGGSSFDDASLADERPDLTVSRVMEWQLKHHEGFVGAYKSTILHAPIYAQGDAEWGHLGAKLRVRRAMKGVAGLQDGKVLLILGETDPVIVPEETEEDARRVLGDEAVTVKIIEGAGHEVGITRGREVADMIAKTWGLYTEVDE